jgi:hypothetical protein
MNMQIELSYQQLQALEMLSTIGDYYIDNMEPSNSQYEDDKESVAEAQKVISYLSSHIVYVVRAYNQFGEWMDDIGYFGTKESAEICLLKTIEGDSGDEDSWNYHIEDYAKEI